MKALSAHGLSKDHRMLVSVVRVAQTILRGHSEMSEKQVATFAPDSQRKDEVSSFLQSERHEVAAKLRAFIKL